MAYPLRAIVVFPRIWGFTLCKLFPEFDPVSDDVSVALEVAVFLFEVP